MLQPGASERVLAGWLVDWLKSGPKSGPVSELEMPDLP